MWNVGDVSEVADIVRYHSKERADKIALIEGGVTRTYAQLHARSSAIANRLLELGVSPGSTIGYLGKNSIEFYEVWFAAVKMGSALAPFNWRCAVAELVPIIEDANPSVVFVGEEYNETISAVKSDVGGALFSVSFSPSILSGGGLTTWLGDISTQDPALPVSKSDIALLSYTSGTTGVPKGVMATQEAFLNAFLIASMEPSMEMRDDDILLMSLPNFHLAGSWVSLAALFYGAAISILPAFEVSAYLKTLRRDRPTIAPLVPLTIKMLLESPEREPDDFSSVRSIMYFGSPIGPQLLRQAIDSLNCEFYQYYGTTEIWFSTILHHKYHVSDNVAYLSSCGVPLPLVQIKLLDTNNLPVAVGAIGEMWILTPAAFTGYRNRPEVTAEVLQGGWYRTGDLARQDEGGFYYLVDRAKDMIISGGENIYSAEVELALNKHPGVSMSAVIGVKDLKWGEKVTAVVVPVAGVELTEVDIQNHCRLFLAGYKVPKQVIFDTALPLTPSGKVQKAILREQFSSQQ